MRRIGSFIRKALLGHVYLSSWTRTILQPSSLGSSSAMVVSFELIDHSYLVLRDLVRDGRIRRSLPYTRLVLSPSLTKPLLS